MINVTILFSTWYEAPNGASTFVRSFYTNKNAYYERGVNVKVFSREKLEKRDFSGNQISENNTKNILKSIALSLIQHFSILTILYTYLMEERSCRNIVKSYLSTYQDDDIVHCQEDDTCYYLLKYRKDKKAKVFVTMHSDGDDFAMLYESRPGFNTWLGRKYLYRKLNYILEHADKIGFVSRTSMLKFHSLHPDFPKEKLFFVYNGIEKKQMVANRPSNTDVINYISVGSVCDRKNQFCIIKALAKLPMDIQKRSKIILVGDGPMLESIRSFVNDHKGLNVDLVGNSKEVDKYLAKADVFILPSKNEGLPISIIEAMRSGLPIIGSNVAGIPEQIEEGISGYVIEPTINGVQKAMVAMSSKSIGEIRLMGEKSYNLFIKQFTLSAMFDNYSNLYKSI